MRNTDRPAGVVRIALPSFTSTGKLCLRDQHASAWIDVERARMYGVGFDVLDLHGLAVDWLIEYTTMLFSPPLKTFLTVNVDRVLGAIRSIQITAVRMHVDRACGLTRPDVLRLGERSARNTISGLILPPSIL